MSAAAGSGIGKGGAVGRARGLGCHALGGAPMAAEGVKVGGQRETRRERDTNLGHPPDNRRAPLGGFVPGIGAHRRAGSRGHAPWGVSASSPPCAPRGPVRWRHSGCPGALVTAPPFWCQGREARRSRWGG